MQPKNHLSHHLPGMTLVELLIVIAIIGVVSTITIVSLITARVNREVQSAAQQLSAHIREMQNYALTGRQMTTAAGRRDCMYGVEKISSGNNPVTQYRLIRSDRNQGATGCSTSGAHIIPISTFTLPHNVSIVQDGNTNNSGWKNNQSPIMFFLPRARIDPTGDIRITVSKNAGLFLVQHSICLYPSGRIQEVTGATCP